MAIKIVTASSLMRYPLVFLLALNAVPCAAQLMIIPIPGKALPDCPETSEQRRLDAVKLAKLNLPKFWQTYREAWVKGSRFTILGGFARRDRSTAYLWAVVTGSDGRTFQGTLLSGDTRDLAFRKGDTVTGSVLDSVDWAIQSQWNSRWYGLFLKRATLPNCTAEQRADLMNGLLTADAIP